MSERSLTIHGHFYQPPRENPWLEAIERQESAHPYHDWNERIQAECYSPNSWSRILDDEGRIVRIVNNYERISFNFGPTLLAWMEPSDPGGYAAILEADRRSARRFSGHGNAIAQAYGHLIMPLASPRDRRTQVRWGAYDFERRFGRRPEGMWLPETAVDLDTLEALVDEGIGWTILAPHQAAAVRLPGEEQWRDVADAQIDPRRPYVQRLPSGRSIALFFYDGPLSRAVAFEQLLESGPRFAERLRDSFGNEVGSPRLVHIATDGETYGHHHRHGEMALSMALELLDRDPDVELTNYGEHLEKHPPTEEVRILENTSWSCAHGVERWRSDCGCSTGGRPGWNQAWREPLRAALDWLRDELEPRYEREAAKLFGDPWAARDGYIAVILDRSDESRERFFAEHARGPIEGSSRVRALELLELQRHAMLMYTSCGWFFSELSGIETVQVIQYAGRAVQLGERLFGDSIEEGFLERLEKARSNLPAKGTGRAIYHVAVKPARVDLPKVGAHYAVSSLFEEYPDEARVYCYIVSRLDDRRRSTGRARLAIGHARVASTITRESAELAYAVLHLGDHNVVGGVQEYPSETADQVQAEIEAAFDRADYPVVMRLLEDAFHASRYSLRSLFRDEQRRILNRILESSVERDAALYVELYERRAPLMRFLAELGMQAPVPFRLAAQYALNAELRKAVAEESDVDAARRLAEAARLEGVELEQEELAWELARALDRRIERLEARPADPERLEELACFVDLAIDLAPEVSLWSVQNAYWRLLQVARPPALERAAAGDPEAAAWLERFGAVGERLSMAPAPEEAAVGERVP